MALRRFRSDLHIHSCLSPCGELSNFPRQIVERALAEGLQIIALCDHNSAENAPGILRAARGTGLKVFPGMELTTEEEVHILGVFPVLEDLLPLQKRVFRALPRLPTRKRFAQDQAIIDENDEVLGFSPHALFAPTRLSAAVVVDGIHRGGGLAIAAHIDRGAFSLISQLGFIPDDLDLDALEVSPRMTNAEARTAFRPPPHLPLVRFSDAHQPAEIGRTATDFILAAPTFAEVRMAFRGLRGRRIVEP
jgi:3',5'-nucleoside bisphosphate phosphatase